MRSRSGVVLGALVIMLSLSGCGTPSDGDVEPETPRASSSPTASTDAAALAQAQSWLAAAALPPGAVPAEKSPGGFMSYTGWACGPVVELEGYWTIVGMTVAETADWLISHPTADLITTAAGPVPVDPGLDSATVGYIPAPGAQEGIVYTIGKTADGVKVRAEVAAQTDAAKCPPLPDGGRYGPPGQG